VLFFLVEHADDSIDRLSCIDCVKCAHDEVSGLRSGETDFHGFAITHFADKDDLWRLSESGAQTRSKVAESVPISRWLNVALFC